MSERVSDSGADSGESRREESTLNPGLAGLNSDEIAEREQKLREETDADLVTLYSDGQTETVHMELVWTTRDDGRIRADVDDYRRVQIGDVKTLIYAGESALDLYERLNDLIPVKGAPLDPDRTVLVRAEDMPDGVAPVPAPTAEDFVPIDLSTVEDGDVLETYRLPAELSDEHAYAQKSTGSEETEGSDKEQLTLELVEEALDGENPGRGEYDDPAWLDSLTDHVAYRSERIDDADDISMVEAEGIINRLIEKGHLRRVTDSHWMDDKVTKA